jgi:hypothetical protein
MLQRFLADLLRLRDLKEAGEVPDQFDRIVRMHYRLVGRHVEVLRRAAGVPVVVVGRVETEPGSHDNWTEYRESFADRRKLPLGPLRLLRFLAWPVLFYIRYTYMHASERAANRFVIAVRPLVRIFVGTHIRRSVEDLMKGYTYLAVSLDPSEPHARERSAWLNQARDELSSLSQLLPTWRSTATALVAIPFATTVPALVYTAADTKDLPETIVKFAPFVLSQWRIWVPAGLYLSTFVSWSYAYKRHLFLGTPTTSRGRIEFRRTVYLLETKLISELPVRRRKERPLDLLLSSVPYLYFGAVTVWLPFSGIRNEAGEPAPIANVFGGLFLVSLGAGHLMAMAWRKQR